MSHPGSYSWRQNLQYNAGEKPKFLQDLEQQTKGRDDQIRREQQRQRLAHRSSSSRKELEEMPVLVDSEGNILPVELLESEAKLDSQFSDLPASEDAINEGLTKDASQSDEHDDVSLGRALKRSRKITSADFKESNAKNQAKGRLVSFTEDDL